ncbi:Molybdenum cofactor guanylyltransferase [Pseudochrobactrum sp. MP213Fo]
MLMDETTLTGKHVLGLILAGGTSQRLGGGDKSLRPLGEHSILHLVSSRLKPQLKHIVLSANSDPLFFENFGYPVINDGTWHHSGPLAGILAGCRHAKQLGCSHIMSVAADTPFFPPDLLQRLFQAKQQTNAEIIFARSDTGTHPTFALWPTTIAASLENWLTTSKRRSIRAFADNHSISYAVFDGVDSTSGLDPFFNINTRNELMLARSAWQIHNTDSYKQRDS